MKKIAFRAITIVVIAFLVSCGNKTKEADELRLQGEFEKAAELYEQAAKHGDGYACFRLGNCYQTGLGVDKDEKKAFDLYKKGAKEDCIQAQVKEACCYIYGKGIEKDEEKGVKMIENLAEESKHPYAKETLASLYIFGVEGLIEKDYKKALTILEECKEEPYGLYLLGELYFNNEGYEIDYPKAMEFFNKAYELGDRYSANLLGYMYQYGKGVSPNIQEAISWYTKAANMRGNTQAMMNLANISYENDS